MSAYNRAYFQDRLRLRYRVTDLLRSQIASLPTGARVLDLGCGDLQVFKDIARLRPDLKLHGVDVGDIPPESRSPAIQFTQCEIKDFAPDAAYDLVLAIDVLEHLPQPQELVKCARQALAANGRLYINVPSVTKLFLFGDENFYSDYTHVRPFNAKSIARLLMDHGFETETVVAGGCAGLRAVPRLFYYLGRGLLTANATYLNAGIRLIGGHAVEAVGQRT